MRHRLIHGYYDVDPDIVWDTVQEDLPPLIAAIKKILPFALGSNLSNVPIIAQALQNPDISRHYFACA